jgi:hypothetical protein
MLLRLYICADSAGWCGSAKRTAHRRIFAIMGQSNAFPLRRVIEVDEVQSE